MKRHIVICTAIVAIGFAFRVMAALIWQNSISGETLFRFGDSDSYWTMATKIAQGLPYQYGSSDSRVFRAPLYPLFLSPWTWIDGTSERTTWMAILAARIAGCLMGALCIAITIHLANKLFCNQSSKPSVEVGIWAGLLAALYPGAIGMSIFILSEAIFCPLMLFSLGCTSLAIQAKKQERWEVAWSWMLLSGAISGAACLARPSWSLWPAVLFSYLIVVMFQSSSGTLAKNRLGWRWIFSCVLFCVGICMVMIPWWVRNYLETEKFVPTTLQVGASLYDGWHPGASGTSDEGMKFVNAFIADQNVEDHREILAGNKLVSTLEWRLDQRLKNAAIGWAFENSSDAMRLGLVKFRKTWSPLPVARELGSDAVRWLEAIGYSAIMSFAVIGIWQCRSQIGAWLFAMPCVYFALLHVFFVGSVRYRQPAVLAICVLGGVGCTTIVRWIYSKPVDGKTSRSPTKENGTKLDGSVTSNDVTADNSPD